MAMDRTRIAKVEQVTLSRRGEQVHGALHLTPHHLIFVHKPPKPPVDSHPQPPPPRPRELWLTYPIIAHCTFRPSPTSRTPSSIRLRCRDFSFVCFYFGSALEARDVYDSIKAWTCKLGRIDKLYAFSYIPAGPEATLSSIAEGAEGVAQRSGRGVTEKSQKGIGWTFYDPMKEFRRLGIAVDSNTTSTSTASTSASASISSLAPPNKAWRLTTINSTHSFSPSYPSQIVVPAAISDTTLNYAGRYRSRARIPALTYLHPVNNCSITRCSQPMVGVRQNRSAQDEALLAAIFNTTRNERPLEIFANPTPTPEREESGSVKEGSIDDTDLSRTNAEALEDAVISRLQNETSDLSATSTASSARPEPGIEDGKDAASISSEDDKTKQKIYGAQQRNMIIDARPSVNAYMNTAQGMGTENMDNYKFATKAYLGIANIHVMRDSLNAVVDTLKDSDLIPTGPSKEALAKTGWLKHIANMLDGVGLIARQVALQHSHVLIHCSDGWDRTSQLSSLSQICLDPYYRTIEGFIVLVEKDWLAFGHQFKHRSGHLNSEKWFTVENERIGGTKRVEEEEKDSVENKDPSGDPGALAGAQRTFENAFLSAKGFFTKQNNDSRESLNVDSEGEPIPTRAPSGTGKSSSKEDKHGVTKVKETSPIFHQFLDATYQMTCQYPTRFEFSERFLKRLLYHTYSCQYGTFLYDSEKERKEAKLSEKTYSVWDYFLARPKDFLNPKYDPEIDDNVRGKERLIFPRVEEVRWWHEVFGRTDEEMNGKASFPLKIAVNGASDGEGESEMSSYGMQSQVSNSVPVSRARTPVLTGVETSQATVGISSPQAGANSHAVEVAVVHKDGGHVTKAVTTEIDMPPASQKIEEEQLQTVSEPVLSKGADETIEQQISAAIEPVDAEPQHIEHPRETEAVGPDDSTTTLSEEPQHIQHPQDQVTAFADEMDPLGIGEATEVVTQSRSMRDRRKEQMDNLLS